MSFALTFKVLYSTSTNFGFKPACTNGHREVGQHNDGIMLHRFY